MLNFILPTERNRDDVLSFYEEIEAVGGECIGAGGCKSYDRWLTEMRNRRTGKNLPGGYVRENFYLCYEGSRLIGVFSLKFELTEFLLHYGGHIGYATRPSNRGRGLAVQMLKQGLELSRELGFDRILCVCDSGSYASEGVILKNGGVFENELYDPDENVWVRRFRIPL